MASSEIFRNHLNIFSIKLFWSSVLYKVEPTAKRVKYIIETETQCAFKIFVHCHQYVSETFLGGHIWIL